MVNRGGCWASGGCTNKTSGDWILDLDLGFGSLPIWIYTPDLLSAARTIVYIKSFSYAHSNLILRLWKHLLEIYTGRPTGYCCPNFRFSLISH